MLKPQRDGNPLRRGKPISGRHMTILSFARITSQHDLLTFSVIPCARALYNFLLRRYPAGKEQEVYLEDFQHFSGLGRIRQYCMRQIQNALKDLVAIGVVRIERRYTGKIFKLIACHPDQKLESKTENKFSDWKKNSKIEHSNPDSVVTTNRDPVETTNTVVVLEETKLEEPKLSIEHEEILEESKELGVTITKPLVKVILMASLEIFRDALNALKERKNQGKVKCPTAYLIAAIRGRWRPNGMSETVAPNGFTRWFNQAYEEGLVKASELRNGVQWVCDLKYHWHRWEDFKQQCQLLC